MNWSFLIGLVLGGGVVAITAIALVYRWAYKTWNRT